MKKVGKAPRAAPPKRKGKAVVDSASSADEYGDPSPKRKRGKGKKTLELEAMQETLGQKERELESSNAHLLALARDYKRIMALLDQYQSKDTSLLCESQMSQSAPMSQGMPESQGTSFYDANFKNAVEGFRPSQEDPDFAVLASAMEAAQSLEEQLSQSQNDSMLLGGLWGSQPPPPPTTSASNAAAHLLSSSAATSTSAGDDAIAPLSLPLSERTDGASTSLNGELAVAAAAAAAAASSSSGSSAAAVRVGVGVIVTSGARHPGCVLVGKRKGSHGPGKLALPGGHLEVGESWEECALRELDEETGLQQPEGKAMFGWVTNDIDCDGGGHYVTLFMQVDVSKCDAEPELREPHKCSGWEWISWSRLQEAHKAAESGGKRQLPLFKPLLNLLATEFDPFKQDATDGVEDYDD